MDADSDRKPSPNDDAIGQTEVTSFKEQNIEQFTESSAAKKKIKYRTIQTVCLCASTFGVVSTPMCMHNDNRAANKCLPLLIFIFSYLCAPFLWCDLKNT
jgi:hypothetical protein